MTWVGLVKRRDEEKHGHYRTKALILDVYRKMADAIATGVPYKTILDPPPADPGVAHSPHEEETIDEAPFRAAPVVLAPSPELASPPEPFGC
jgi:hypothetical protein